MLYAVLAITIIVTGRGWFILKPIAGKKPELYGAVGELYFINMVTCIAAILTSCFLLGQSF